jgi:hypothetical protein
MENANILTILFNNDIIYCFIYTPYDGQLDRNNKLINLLLYLIQSFIMQ